MRSRSDSENHHLASLAGDIDASGDQGQRMQPPRSMEGDGDDDVVGVDYDDDGVEQASSTENQLD